MGKIIFSITLFILVFIPDNAFAEEGVVINEVLVHPGSGNAEWIEFFVANNLSIEGYWLDDDLAFTDDTGSSTKKQITSVTVGSDTKHIVFHLPSALFNNAGDTVALFDRAGNLIDDYTYTEDPGTDVSLGRTPDGTGNFDLLVNATMGSANSLAKPTVTPTPTPTAKPTKEPTPTKESKTTATPVARESSSPIAQVRGINITPSSTKRNATKVASNGAYPTAILRENSKEKHTDSPSPTKQVMVESITSSPSGSIAIILGGVSILACGILIFLKRRGIFPNLL